jgi:hypothetical protein
MKDKKVTTRFTQEEYDHMKAQADEAGKDVSTWIRSRLDNQSNIAGGSDLIRLVAETSEVVNTMLGGVDNATYRHRLAGNLESITALLKEVLRSEEQNSHI